MPARKRNRYALRLYHNKCFRIFKALSIILILVCSSTNLWGQRNVSPADTGRISWGHNDFKGYDRAAMCNRALDEVERQHYRIFKRDTVFKSVSGNSDGPRKFHNATIETVKRCIGNLKLDEQPRDQLWAVARIYTVLGEKEKSWEVVEKIIENGKDRPDKIELGLMAIQLYVEYGEDYRPHLYHFAKILRDEEPIMYAIRYQVDIKIADMYYDAYMPDSAIRYSDAAIENLEKMTEEEKGVIPSFRPFEIQISIANINGDIPLQERILDRAKNVLGNGNILVNSMLYGIDLKKSIYNKKLASFDDVIWENYDGVPRPLTGKPSLFVVVNHNCGISCYGQYRAIKRLKYAFKDSVDIVLVVPTMGFAPGTGPLEAVEEAKVAARFFKDVHALPFTLLADESPIHKLPDGRIIRDKSPIIQMFSDIAGASALVTDEQGRLQWVGALRTELDIRSVNAVIDRVLTKEK